MPRTKRFKNVEKMNQSAPMMSNQTALMNFSMLNHQPQHLVANQLPPLYSSAPIQPQHAEINEETNIDATLSGQETHEQTTSELQPSFEAETQQSVRRVERRYNAYWKVEIIDSQGNTKEKDMKVKEVLTLNDGERIGVEFDDQDAPIGHAQRLLAVFLGTLASSPSLFPISFDKWPLIPASYFNECYDNIIKPRFYFKSSEENVLQYLNASLGKKWGSNRQKLWNEFYDPTKSRDALICNVPEAIPHDQWATFVDYRLRPETQTLCKRNAENRKKQTIPHSGGFMSNARRRAEMIAKTGQKLGRGRIYIETHMNKDGTYIHEEARVVCERILQEMSQSTTEDSEISPSDVVEKVLGKEHNGRVRCLGLGIPPTKAFKKSRTRFRGSSITSTSSGACSFVEILWLRSWMH